VTDRVLLSADRNNIEECIDLAHEYDLGLEIMAFAYPDILDGPWENTLATYRAILRDLPGPLTLHGPFMDMVSGSPDGQINQVCYQRYQHAIHVAHELEAELVVLHANFIGSLHNVPYRKGWHERNVPFWASLAEYAASRGVVIALENMWEFEPGIIVDVLREVNHRSLRACLDVGHAHLFSDKSWQFQDWLDALEPWLVHTHMNNNNGIIDEHYGFDWEFGALDYKTILAQIRKLKSRPNIVLEMYHVPDMRDSLHYLEIGESKRTIA
jgi:sugar phosphate isomerase/epimerase